MKKNWIIFLFHISFSSVTCCCVFRHSPVILNLKVLKQFQGNAKSQKVKEKVIKNFRVSKSAFYHGMVEVVIV